MVTETNKVQTVSDGSLPGQWNRSGLGSKQPSFSAETARQWEESGSEVPVLLQLALQINLSPCGYLLSSEKWWLDFSLEIQSLSFYHAAHLDWKMKYLIIVCSWNSDIWFGESTCVMQSFQFCSPRTPGSDSVDTAIILSLIFKVLAGISVQFVLCSKRWELLTYPKILGNVQKVENRSVS